DEEQQHGEAGGDEVGLPDLAVEALAVGLGLALEHIRHSNGIDGSDAERDQREDAGADAEDREILVAEQVRQHDQVDVEKEIGGERDKNPGEREAPPALPLARSRRLGCRYVAY